MDSGDLSDYRQALEEEWKVKEEQNSEKLESARQTLRNSVDKVATELVDLALNAESEAVRSSTGRFIYERVFGKSAAGKEDNPVEKLISSLTKED